MRVIGLLRSMHRHVFVDCGHVLEPAVKEALDCSDQIIVVTTLSLPTIRRTKRLLETLGAAHIRRKGEWWSSIGTRTIRRIC